MSHAQHEDVHSHGLADDCGRCAELAERPYYDADEGVLLDLVVRTLANRYGGEDSPYGEPVPARSDTEAAAMATIMNTLERMGRLFEVAPAPLLLYLSGRWNIELTTKEG